ncbi:MAG: histidine kinase [Cyclobacteriaceae bacterium]|nr:histidine kinase [Cyclobacteriaceae bacterium]MCH8517603.1 histidine kinase [Cyclobacteriaceae bacterium]
MMLILYSLLVLLSLLSIYLYVQNRRLKSLAITKDSKAALTYSPTKTFELKELLYPHFFLNAITNIQYLIISNEPSVARKALDRLAIFFRSTIKHHGENWITLSDELELTKTYLDLEKLRWEDNFNFSIVCSSDLDDVLIPPHFIRVFTQNAISERLRHCTQSKQIDLVVERENDDICCSIIDNASIIDSEDPVGFFEAMPHLASLAKVIDENGLSVTVQAIKSSDQECMSIGTKVVLKFMQSQ